jgi:uncharacterized protein (DUF58 family)
MPTRHGVMVALAIFGVFAISVRIQNNMLLLMSLVLFVLFMLSLLWAGQNLQGLRLVLPDHRGIIASQENAMAVRVLSDRPVYDIGIDTGSGQKRGKRGKLQTVRGHDRPGEDHIIRFTPVTRGRQPLPLVRLETHFPVGLARAWAWISPAEVLVAPAPDFTSAHLPLSASSGWHAGRSEGRTGVDSLQDWVPGTPENRISWKRYAASDRLLEKTGEASDNGTLTIDYDAVAHLGHERALSAMCGAVLNASRAGRPFHFRVGDVALDHVHPPAVRKVLDALAIA